MYSFRSYQLVGISIFFSSGIFFSYCYGPVNLLPAILLTSFSFLYYQHTRRVFSADICLLLLFILLGFDYGTRAIADPPFSSHISNIVRKNQEAVAIGHIKRIYGYNGELSRFDLDTLYLGNEDSTYKEAQGIIRFTLRQQFPDAFFPGDAIAVRAELRPPNRNMTPGTFDYPAYLAHQQIYITGSVDTPLNIQKLQIIPVQNKSLYYKVEKIRESINRFIDSTLKGDIAAIYKAILTGDRSSISTEVIESFKAAGVLHILAISGLHISILGLVLYRFLFWLLRRSEYLMLHTNTKKTAVIFSIVPLLFYTMLAGGKAPVMRAFIMSLLIILAVCSNKKHSLPPLIACAALFILVVSPDALFTPSFQLTFAAIISIGLILPRLQQIFSSRFFAHLPGRLSTAMQWIAAGCLVSFAATLGTAPLLAYHFNRVSLIGFLSNIIIEPLLCLWSLTLGFMAIPLIFIAPAAAEFILQTGGHGIYHGINAAIFFQAIPYSYLFLPKPHYAIIVFYYLSIIIIIRSPNSLRPLNLSGYVAFICSIFLLLHPPQHLLASRQKHALLTFIDIGHGSCSYISLAGGKKMLIDGGGISSPNFDTGQRIIAPFLWDMGVRSIDEIVVTHPDSDHYNGIAFILKHFDVQHLWISSEVSSTKSWNDLMSLAHKRGVQIHVARAGEFIHNGENSSLLVLANTAIENSLNNGLVLKFTHDKTSVLFPGDISLKTEAELIKEGVDVDADILLAAHHGSKTSNSLVFINHVSPERVIVSSGKSRKKQFPSEQLLQICSDKLIPIHAINETGTIAIKIEKGEYTAYTPLSGKNL